MSASVDQFFKAASHLMDIKATRIDPHNYKYHRLSSHSVSLSSLGSGDVFFLMLHHLWLPWRSPVPCPGTKRRCYDCSFNKTFYFGLGFCFAKNNYKCLCIRVLTEVGLILKAKNISVSNLVDFQCFAHFCVEFLFSI